MTGPCELAAHQRFLVLRGDVADIDDAVDRLDRDLGAEGRRLGARHLAHAIMENRAPEREAQRLARADVRDVIDALRREGRETVHAEIMEDEGRLAEFEVGQRALEEVPGAVPFRAIMDLASAGAAQLFIMLHLHMASYRVFLTICSVKLFL